MAISNDSRGDAHIVILSAVAAANTAGATSSWIDVRPYKGNLTFTHQVGALTGSITAKLRRATSDAGAGAADIAGATFTAVTVGDKVQSVTVSKGAGPFIQYVGTIVTGPVLVSVILSAFPVSP